METTSKQVTGRRICGIAVAGLLGAGLMMPQAATGAILNVDFDHSNEITQNNYDGFFAGNQDDETQVIDNIAVRLHAPGNFDTRDRGAIGGGAHPVSDLARDFVFRSGGFNLQLGDATNPLPAGNYLLTGYHHDTAGSVDSGPYVVSDAIATAEARALARSSTEFDAAEGDIRTQVVQLRSDGTSVTIDMQASGLRGMSAFDLEEIAPADEVNVDFGESGQQRQDDFLVFDASDNDAASIERGQNYIASFGDDNVVHVEIGGADRAISRGVSHDHALGDLADSWFGNQGGNTTLTLTGLEAGTYQMTTYHHDAEGQQGTFNVLVDGDEVLADITNTTGTLSPGDSIATADFSFTADGTNPVVLTYEMTDSWTIVNGMTLIPEPASLALLGAGGLVLLSRRNRQRG